ncbi:hypothetical protein GOB57_25135 [Sinorhizobium meliloti]|nr:hypothetical protein [Sinorhizobium meliloti]
MTNRIISPDEALLAFASRTMAVVYVGFGISPLALQFWPPLLAVALSAAALLFMSVDVDPYYLPIAAMCVIWTRMFWRDHASLRADSKKEWSSDLFKRYGGKAELLRTGTVWVRYLLLAAALVTTLIAFSDISEEMNRLATWQRCTFPLNLWALVALAYSQSAEPPPPHDGDFFGIARRA